MPRPTPEQAARAERDKADPTRKDTLANAQALLDQAQLKRREGEYEDAYDLQRQARDLYASISHSYNASFQEAARSMRNRANPLAPTYEEAEELYRQGVEAYQAGNYENAYERFKAARAAYYELGAMLAHAARPRRN